MTKANEGWIKTTCAYCGVGCGVEARPRSSGVLEIRGDKEHPSNQGKLCTKGAALGDTVISNGRLLQPMLKSDKERQVLSWDAATSMVADKFRQTVEQHGPDSVAFYVSGQLLTEDYYVANKLMKGFIGSGNIDSNSRLCMASSVVGHKRAFGSDTVPIIYQDIETTDLVVIVGSNLAWCHPVLYQRLRIAKQNNGHLKVVVIDPRRTETCDISDVHLPLESGSDVALFNGLLNYLALNKKIDESYIQSYTNGFDNALSIAQAECNLEDKTQLTTEQLLDFYQLFSGSEKVVTIYSQGVNQSSCGSDKVNSIINCHLATGKIGKVGSGPFSVTGQPNAMGGREVGALANTLAAHMEFGDPVHKDLIQQFWGTQTLATQPGLKAVDMFKAIESGQIKAVWIMATNPAVSLPDSNGVRAALEKCPFVVVSDCIEDTETTRLADLVLPAQGWSEKSGTVTNSERRISRQRRLLPSPGMAKPDWWIISQVAQKMGYASAFDYLHEAEIFKEYAQMTTLGNTNGQRDLTLIGLTGLDDTGYSQLLPQQWPVLSLQTESMQQRLFCHGEFFTPDKKANFVPVAHIAPLSQTSDQYPLILNSGRIRDQWHTMSRTGLSARLADHTPEPTLMVHPDTAREYDLEHQKVAVVHSQKGQSQARVVSTTDMQPKQVFMPIHWNSTTAKDSKPCSLIDDVTDDLSGQPEFKNTPVYIKPLNYVSAAMVVSRGILDLSDHEYWVQQKVEHGYLYRIESSLSPYQLTQKLKLNLLDGDENIISLDSGENGGMFRYAAFGAECMTLCMVVQRHFTTIDIEQIVEEFSITPGRDVIERIEAS